MSDSVLITFFMHDGTTRSSFFYRNRRTNDAVLIEYSAKLSKGTWLVIQSDEKPYALNSAYVAHVQVEDA